MAKWPEEFSHVQALVLLNVVSGKTFIERGREPAPRSGESSCQTRRAFRELTGFRFDRGTT
jgi:uncharacterized protein